MIDAHRLKILTDSAKYDVSCSSSGSKRKNSGGLGNASYPGICHSFTQDGRCISLLKILLSNDCAYDCGYCLNRRSNDVERASATPEEICELTVNFYRRNYIEGLFLSSAVEKSPDATMEKLLRTVVMLRKDYRFNGYIHLKGIPRADSALIDTAARYADRMSFNIELPSEQSLKLLAPQKDKNSIFMPMKELALKSSFPEKKGEGKYLPAGQTTQMIVGASPESDSSILSLTQALYRKMGLKRVYYSSYVPVNPTNPYLPQLPVGLLREHRLYQADWLLRFYGFNADEILDEGENLSPDFDPKCAWALRNMDLFPVEINTAPFEMLLRVPGIGLRGANRIYQARKYSRLGFEELKKMRIVMKRAAHFITCGGKFGGTDNHKILTASLRLAERADNAQQLSLFSTPDNALSALSGEL